jgi:hypothetical protein
MTPKERYEKFVKSGRKVQKFYFEGKHSCEIARQGMYRIRQRLKETFEISSKDNVITISDNPFK